MIPPQRPVPDRLQSCDFLLDCDGANVASAVPLLGPPVDVGLHTVRVDLGDRRGRLQDPPEVAEVNALRLECVRLLGPGGERRLVQVEQ